MFTSLIPDYVFIIIGFFYAHLASNSNNACIVGNTRYQENWYIQFNYSSR